MTYITSALLIILFVATLRQQNAKNTIVYTSEIVSFLKVGCKLGCKSVQNYVQNVQKATVSHYGQNADRA